MRRVALVAVLAVVTATLASRLTEPWHSVNAGTIYFGAATAIAFLSAWAFPLAGFTRLDWGGRFTTVYSWTLVGATGFFIAAAGVQLGQWLLTILASSMCLFLLAARAESVRIKFRARPAYWWQSAVFVCGILVFYAGFVVDAAAVELWWFVCVIGMAVVAGIVWFRAMRRAEHAPFGPLFLFAWLWGGSLFLIPAPVAALVFLLRPLAYYWPHSDGNGVVIEKST